MEIKELVLKLLEKSIESDLEVYIDSYIWRQKGVKVYTSPKRFINISISNEEYSNQRKPYLQICIANNAGEIWDYDNINVALTPEEEINFQYLINKLIDKKSEKIKNNLLNFINK